MTDLSENSRIFEKLSAIEKLLLHILVIKLYEKGLTQDMITKQLHVAKLKINTMLKGLKEEKDKLT